MFSFARWRFFLRIYRLFFTGSNLFPGFNSHRTRLGVKLKMIAANKSANHPLSKVTRTGKSNAILIYRTWTRFIVGNSSLTSRSHKPLREEFVLSFIVLWLPLNRQFIYHRPNSSQCCFTPKIALFVVSLFTSKSTHKHIRSLFIQRAVGVCVFPYPLYNSLIYRRLVR